VAGRKTQRRKAPQETPVDPSPTTSRRLHFGRYDYGAFFSFFSYACASLVIATALKNMLDSLGFPLEEGGAAQGGILDAGRTASMSVTLILCGFFAGRWGKRRTLGFSVALIGVAMIVISVSPAYGILLVGMVVAGFGQGILEGLATPFVQDLHPDEPGRYLNIAHGFWPIGSLTTAIGAGYLLYRGVPWRWIVAGVGVMTLGASVVLLAPERKGHEYPEHPEVIPTRVVWGHVMDILRTPRAWVFFAAMFVAGAAEFGPTYWVPSYGVAWRDRPGLPGRRDDPRPPRVGLPHQAASALSPRDSLGHRGDRADKLPAVPQ
jgi:MFS family permease